MNQSAISPFTPSPFKVGDRIKQIDWHSKWQPAATVTAITDTGFAYEFDTPVPFIARWGMEFLGGECYPAGYEFWKLLPTPSHD